MEYLLLAVIIVLVIMMITRKKEQPKHVKQSLQTLTPEQAAEKETGLNIANAY